MTFRKSLMATSVLLAVAGAALADPSIRLQRGSVGNGLAVSLDPAGLAVNAFVIDVRFDTAAGNVANALDSFVLADSTNWKIDAFNVKGGNTASLAGTYKGTALGQTTAGPLFYIKPSLLTGKNAVKMTLTTDSNISDSDYNSYYPAAEQSAAVINGKVRNLNGPSNNALAVGVIGADKVVAAVVGTKLYVMKATDLTDATGFEGGKELGAASSGRPAFGTINGAVVIAVGTDTGAAVFDAAGAQTTNTAVGSVKTAPAVDSASNTIYWPVATAEGARLVRQPAAGTAETISIGGAGTDITSSPMVVGDALLVGTSEGVKYFRKAGDGTLTPQADAVTNDPTNTSPVWVGDGNAVVGSAAGKVYKIVAATGTPDATVASVPAAAAPLSDPFFGNGAAVFGGTDGKIYSIAPATMAVTAVDFGTAKVNSPVVVGTTIVAGDNTGLFGPVGAQVDLAGALGKASAATGVGAGNDWVINTGDGDIVALPQ